MKFLFDLFPVALFFVAIQIWDIFVATAVAIGATVLQVGWLKLRGKKVEPMLWASLAIIVVFGGLTLLPARQDLHPVEADGALLAVRRRARRRARFSAATWSARCCPTRCGCPTRSGRASTGAGSAFFVFMGALNLYVAFNYSEKIWATFKLFGGMGLMLLFVVAQSLVLAKHIEDEQAMSVAARIRERLAALEPLDLDLVDESEQHAATPATAPAAARTGASPSSRRASPASRPSRATAWCTRRSAS